MYDHRRRCAVAGIGSTDFSRASGRSVLTLAVQASQAAIADAGLTAADIDGIVRSDQDVVNHNALAHALGVKNLTYWGASGHGGAAPAGMIAQAVAAVCSGQATNVLAFRSLNGRSGMRFGVGRAPDSGTVGGNGTYDEFFTPYGLVTPGQMWALIAQRHMLEFGTTSEQLGAIATTVRRRANSNPAAQMFDRQLTMEQYLAAEVIASPLRLFDYCLETDGACAVVVTSAERAGDLAKAPVLITAVAQGTGPGPQAGIAYPSLLRADLTTQPSAFVAQELYRRAGLGPGDIDVAQIYDCFTITLLVQLEDYGFCKKGEGGPYAASGALDLDGELPVNTSGGNLSEGYIHGMSHIVEGVRQIRGNSTSQVADAEVCLVTSGIPVVSGAMILQKAE
ncbi:MAG TPA: lipid-transfer protein [Jatrophihabitantaceae bacterium]|jgi:acetyl-CoA acetyltransferase